MKFFNLALVTTCLVFSLNIQKVHADSVKPIFTFESKSTQNIFKGLQNSDTQFNTDLAALLDSKGNSPALNCTFSLLQNVAGSNGFVGVSSVHLLVSRCALNRGGGPTFRSAGFYVQSDSWSAKTKGPYYTKKFINF